MTTLTGYEVTAGVHPETATLRNALAYSGVCAAHTGKPYTEAMILGVGGGLGAGYILWEFKEHNIRVLVLGFRKDWQYPVRFMQAVCDRLNVRCSVLEASGRGTAQKNLREAIERGQPVIAWVDRAHLPYYQMPESMKGTIGHIVTVYGLDAGEAVRVADLSSAPFTVPGDVFADGRARIGSYKNRLMLVHGESAGPVDLPAAILAGIRDCIGQLKGESESFSLPTIRKWGRLINDGRNAKGWRKVFSDRVGLYSALKSIYENVALAGSGGDGLRGLYADFLTEAAPVVDKPELNEVAAAYRALAGQWADLAEAALPQSVKPLAETRALLKQRDDLMRAGGDRALAEMQPLSERLGVMSREYNLGFPMADAGIDNLFETLSGKLLAIYEAEMAAVKRLEAAVG